MPRGKIDRQKVLASLNKTCPKCGHQITPAEIKRVSWEEIELGGVERIEVSLEKRSEFSVSMVGK